MNSVMEKFTLTGTLRTICNTSEDPVTLMVSSGTYQTNTGFQSIIWLQPKNTERCPISQRFVVFVFGTFQIQHFCQRWVGNEFEMRGLVCKNYDLRVSHTSSEMQMNMSQHN